MRRFGSLVLVALFCPAALGARQVGATAVSPAISAGSAHSCALTSGGGVECWGINDDGELGDGTAKDRPRPVQVSGLRSGVVAISAGGSQSCALTRRGGVKCWGGNDHGEVGDGTETRRLRPAQVRGLTGGVTAISAGAAHSCALTNGGGVKCWGLNKSGQLGDGTTKDRLRPVRVKGLRSRVTALSAGGYHTCALTSGGGVKCWGSNDDGELGDGTTKDRRRPVQVRGLTSGVVAISAGAFSSCALTTRGGVKCWGDNFSGQLGDGTTKDRRRPVQVSGLKGGVTAISAGASFHTCALTRGAARCWGGNDYGELGDGTKTERLRPAQVSGLRSGVVAISAGDYHSCALSSRRRLKCWGQNVFGQVGDGTTKNRLRPVAVAL